MEELVGEELVGDRVLCTRADRASLRGWAGSAPTLSQERRQLVLSALAKIQMPGDTEAVESCSREEIAALGELKQAILTGGTPADRLRRQTLAQAAGRFFLASRRP